MKIYYITKNKRKIDRAKAICSGSAIFIVQTKIETPEIQAGSSRDVAKYSAKYAGEKLGKPVVKLDVSFHINALNGFPGPYIKYINECLKPEKILEMMSGIKDRTCYWTDALAYFQPGKQVKVFVSNEKGIISDQVRGENGWGMDKIFIPDGLKKTKAQLTDKERIKISNRGHWDQLINYVQKNR